MNLTGVGGASPSLATTTTNLQLDEAQYLGNLFDQINDDDSTLDPSDPNNPGNPTSITQAQFTNAFNTLALPPQLKSLGAAAVFGLLDPNQTGSVSKTNFVDGLTKLLDDVKSGRGHHHAHVASTPSEASDDDTQPSAWQLISQVLGAQQPSPQDLSVANGAATDNGANQSNGDSQRRNRLSL